MQEKQTTRGRRVVTRYSVDDRKRLVKEHTQSGLTKKAFCERNGINLGTFHGWTKYRVALKKGAFAQVKVPAATPAAVEVLLPNGVRIGIRHQGKQDELVSLIRGVAGC
jgi:transposase-like protein